MRSDIPEKLQRLAEQIRDMGYARTTRLTVIQERLLHDELRAFQSGYQKTARGVVPPFKNNGLFFTAGHGFERPLLNPNNGDRGARKMKGYFAQVRRAGFDIGISAGTLTKAMVEVLSQLSPEATPSKDIDVRHLGLIKQMSKTRDINAALAAKENMTPDELLDRLILTWRNDRR